MCVCVCVCVPYHEDVADLGIHGNPADFRGQTECAQSSHVLTITRVTHAVAMVTNIACLEDNLNLCSWARIFKHWRDKNKRGLM